MPEDPLPPPGKRVADVPYRTIITTIALVGLAYLGAQLVLTLQRILTWIVVAAFFAVLLNPPVDFLVQRARLRRTLAAFLVFVVGVAAVGGLMYLFIRPIVTQVSHFAPNFQQYVNDARAGKGEVGKLVKRYHIDRWVDQNQAKLKSAISHSGKQALGIARKVGNTAIAVLTILALTFLMLVEGPRMLSSGVGMLSPPRRQRATKIGNDAARAVTGYMAGNLLISVIAALITYCGLWAFGVPFRTVMAVWVGFADLIPLIGATLGAIPTLFVALLHSPTAAIGMLIIYVVYQQFENHVLQVWIMARTVRLSPLTVMVSLLVGVQLTGLIGALLAIPAAAVIQVVAKDLYQERQRVKAERALIVAADVEAPPPSGNGKHEAANEPSPEH
jgi:predicted PurR-regulated permease PerM